MEEHIKKFKEENKTLEKDNKKLIEENRKLKEQLDKYRKRHLSTVDVKNGKPYTIMKQKVPESGSELKTGVYQ